MSAFYTDVLRQSVRVPSQCEENTVEDYFALMERHIDVTANITADTETKTFNVFQFTGSVLVIDQWNNRLEV